MKGRKVIGGNWKMHKTVKETVEYFEKFNKFIKDYSGDYEIVIFPPFTALYKAKEVAGKNVKIGAQNMFYEDEGAFTGEISPLMLKELGIEYVLIGHSERRKYFNETDEILNQKLKKAISHGFKIIFCVGEKLEEREKGEAERVVIDQLKRGFEGIGAETLNSIVIAYEPVWAIGTGRTATPEIANHMHGLIKDFFKDSFNMEISVLYGGSVKPHNAAELTVQEYVDGLLVGGASLSAESFFEIIKNSR